LLSEEYVINREGQSDSSKSCIKKDITSGLSSIEYESRPEKRRNDRRIAGFKVIKSCDIHEEHFHCDNTWCSYYAKGSSA